MKKSTIKQLDDLVPTYQLLVCCSSIYLDQMAFSFNKICHDLCQMMFSPHPFLVMCIWRQPLYPFKNILSGILTMNLPLAHDSCFEHALLISMKSTPILHFPPPFLTITRLATHIWYCVGRNIHAFTNSLTCSKATLLLSSTRPRFFNFTRILLGYAFKWCSANSLGTPVIFDGYHTNTLLFLRRRLISSCRKTIGNCLPMFIFWFGNLSFITIDFSTFDACSAVIAFLWAVLWIVIHWFPSSSSFMFPCIVAISLLVGKFTSSWTVDT